MQGNLTRRVSDEIGAEDDNDDHNRHSSKRRSRKEKKKKRSDRDRDGHRRSSKHHNRHGGRIEDSVSEAGSQPSRGYRASAEGGDRGLMPEGPSMGHMHGIAIHSYETFKPLLDRMRCDQAGLRGKLPPNIIYIYNPSGSSLRATHHPMAFNNINWLLHNNQLVCGSDL